MENVGRFDISVYETHLVDFRVPLDELPHDFDGFMVGQRSSLLEDAVEVAIAQLGDEVGVVFGCVDVV